MSLSVQQNQNCDNNIAEKENSDAYIAGSKSETNESLSRLGDGNLYKIGSIWFEGMKSVVRNSQINLFPTIYAAQDPKIPKKPPKMRPSELPLYESPHYDYARYKEQKEKCPGYDQKIIHNALFNTVSKFRKDQQENLFELKKFYSEMKREVAEDYRKNMDNFKGFMRDPCNEPIRSTVFLLGPITGLLFARRKRLNDIGTLFSAVVGGLYTGWLCFPKETDETVRNVSAKAFDVLVFFSNFWFGGSFEVKKTICEFPECPEEPE